MALILGVSDALKSSNLWTVTSLLKFLRAVEARDRKMQCSIISMTNHSVGFVQICILNSLKATLQSC